MPPTKRQIVYVDLFDAKVQVAEVTKAQLAAAKVRSPVISAIDDGEMHLLAYVAHQQDAWLLTTADRAAVKAAFTLGLDGCLRSLEELSRACGQKPPLQEWFTTKCLSKVKTDCLLDSI